MTYREAMTEARARLKEASVENEQAESWFLLEYACDMRRSEYYLKCEKEMASEEYRMYQELVAKRCTHIPLQYLTGEQEFMGLVFQVNEHVLIPRQDTETLVEEALRHAVPGMRLLDLCTGSGCIAVSMKHCVPGLTVTASDLSERALQVARENARRNHCEIAFVHSDLFAALEGTFDLIVSNPPYIPEAVIPTLMPEVKDHEPLSALDGKEDGLYFYREIIRNSSRFLAAEGRLLFEIGSDQGKAVSGLMADNGFCEIRVIRDLSGLDRVVSGRKNDR
jgi:release factor glutamine methyltransferase